MSHLVRNITVTQDGPLVPASCLALIRDAHTYLVSCASRSIDHAQQHTDIKSWGTALKRIRVELPLAGRPAIVTPRDHYHNLIEIINQCATMERLLDALTWAADSTSGLADWRIIACHPTTSSAQEDGKKAALDHDLILQDATGTLARFEVSDVASTQDGNRKEEKDLKSLGVLNGTASAERYNLDWHPDRLFLVVSAEFGTRLLRPKHGISRGINRPIHYKTVAQTASTTVIEILHRFSKPLALGTPPRS